MKVTPRHLLKGVAFGAMAVFAALGAQAAVIYDFNATEVNAFGTGPFGSIKLTQNGANVDFTVTLRSDLNFVSTGGPHSIFSFNALGVAVADVTNIKFNGVVAGAEFTVATPGQNEPFGKGFSLQIDCTGGACPSGGSGGGFVDPLTFTVLGSSYADFGFLIPQSGSGQNRVDGTTAFFASDAICVSTSTGGCSNVGATGAIGANKDSKRPPDEVPVPEPASLALVGLGLLGARIARRSLRK